MLGGGACRGVHEANHELMGVCREWRMAAAVVGSARVYDGRGGGGRKTLAAGSVRLDEGRARMCCKVRKGPMRGRKGVPSWRLCRGDCASL